MTAPSKEIIEEHVLPTLRAFLAGCGLEFKDAKTRVVHVAEGFDFLGCTVRQFRHGTRIVCLVKPSKNAVNRHLARIKAILKANKQAKVDDIITRLNPVIRGWCNYYRYTNAKNTFGDIDHRIWEKIWSWCTRRHPMKGKRWIKRRYFMHLGARDWVFGERANHVLYSASRVRVNSKAYVKVKGYSSPFDPALRPYWERRLGRYGKDLCS